MTLESSAEDVLGADASAVSAEGTSNTDVASADPSPADDQGEKTMFDAISEVLGDGDENPEDTPATEKAGTEPPGDTPDAEKAKKAEGDDSSEDDAEGAEDEDLPDEPTDEELNSYKPKTRKRVEQLLEDRAKYRELGTPEEIQEYKASHEQFTGMVNFMDQSGLSVDEVNTGFDIMAAMKTNPEEAYRLLAPYVDQLRTALGEVLPPELQKQVDEGYLTEEAARTLSRSQSREQLALQQAEAARRKADGLQSRQQTERAANEVSAAVSDWETRRMASDPDYAMKQNRIMERIKLHFYENGGQAISPQAAVAMADKAYEEVTKELKAFAPKRPPINPDPDVSSPHHAAAAPKTMAEAIERGLNTAAA